MRWMKDWPEGDWPNWVWVVVENFNDNVVARLSSLEEARACIRAGRVYNIAGEE